MRHRNATRLIFLQRSKGSHYRQSRRSPHRQIPGVSYTHTWTDENAPTNLRTKHEREVPPR